MAQHDNEHAHAWTCSDTLAQALRGHTDLSPADQLALLVAQGADRLPLPGHGHTLLRWRALAEVAAHSLSLAKLYEGHTDALAILSELQADLATEGLRWAVWCAEPPGERVQATSTAPMLRHMPAWPCSCPATSPGVRARARWTVPWSAAGWPTAGAA